MPRRNLVPLVLVAVLALLAAGFAVLAVSAAPPTGSVIVQNATAQTLGSPTGSNSFTLALTLALAERGASGSVVRLFDFHPPDRMVAYQVTPRPVFLGRIPPATISCTLSSYAAMVEGSTPWNAKHGAYTRTETVQEYTARVPASDARTCAPNPLALHGQVAERAIIRSGYLVELTTTTVVPPQTLPGGSAVRAGVQTESLVFVRINGTLTRKLGS